jgi:hypothetical protein
VLPLATRQALHSTLAYFEIFRHPLTAREVWAFAHSTASLAEVEEALQTLVEAGEVWHFDGFYQSQPDPAWVPERLARNRRADQFLPIAHRKGRLIGAFPFVRAVLVSGSLSKHSMAEDSDVDFFIVTTPNRLWLARTLLVLFKKIFLLNSHKFFCVNYFVDTEHLSIEERNLFTATEVVTLLPVYGATECARFAAVNDWARLDFLPNAPLRDLSAVPAGTPSWGKRLLESLLSTPPGNWLDRAAQRLTVAFWQRKFRHFDTQHFEAALKSRRYVSKHHPLWFQEKVLKQHAAKMAERLD